MRSLSPAPSLYSPTIGDVSARDGGSAAHSPRGRNRAAATAAAASCRISVVCFMAVPSVLIRGETEAAPPVHDWPRHRLALQGLRVDGMGRVAGGADGDPQRVLKFVVLDARHHAVDHP